MTTLQADPAALESAAGIFETTAGDLSDAAPGLRVRPDAGVSSGEVATALATLAEAVAAVGGELAATAESLSTTAADLRATDQASAASSRQRGQALAR
jgi:ABC-type transporter Mla subunit MlaD